ncbi:MAG: TMEM175 family protein [Solirubrobacteraceae bacterium]
MSTGRLESFSDGVMAVAITLLVLGIVVPEPAAHPDLGHALGSQWPAYAAYVTSFLTIGIVWINHHAGISRLARADHSILILNLILLMTIAVIPFGTSLLATYLKEGQGQHLAAAVYGGILLAMALTFTALNRQILLRRPELLKVPLSHDERRAIFRRNATGVPPYAAAAALAVVSPYITLGITAALAGFYALPLANLNPPTESTAD